MSDGLILALDIGTSSARALVWDAEGRELEQFRVQIPYEVDTTPDGGVEIGAERLFSYVAESLDRVLVGLGERSKDIRGVGVSTFWHSLVGMDRAGNALTPIYIWADTRSAPQAYRLRQEQDEDALHQRTGCRLHPSYYPAKLLWLQETQPALFASVARWGSPSEYLFGRLFGTPGILSSVCMASGTGIMNKDLCVWDTEILSLLHLNPELFSPIEDLTTTLQGLQPPFGERWSALRKVPFCLAVGDGASGNVGSGCVSPSRFAINLGTSGAIRVLWEEASYPAKRVPKGCWRCRIDRRRPIMGAAFSDGGNVVQWMQKTLNLPSLEALETSLSHLEPGAHGLTFLPFLAGERSMGWNPAARASLHGLNWDTSALDIAHAAMEAIAMRFALATQRLAEQFSGVEEIVASGGALGKSPAWAQIFASAIGRPITLAEEAEASSRGAAMLVKEVLEGSSYRAWETRLGRTFVPNTNHHEQYCALLEKQEHIYNVLS